MSITDKHFCFTFLPFDGDTYREKIKHCSALPVHACRS